jgi:hypothetical protein
VSVIPAIAAGLSATSASNAAAAAASASHGAPLTPGDGLVLIVGFVALVLVIGVGALVLLEPPARPRGGGLTTKHISDRLTGGHQPKADGRPPGKPPFGGSALKPPPCQCQACRVARGECVGR